MFSERNLKMNLEQTVIHTPEHVSLRFKLAGLGSRSAAHIIDWLILSIIYFSLFFIILLFEKEVVPLFFKTASTYLIAVVIIISFLLWWAYFVLFEYFAAGRTPGKMLLGIRVIQDNGQSITFLSALVRNLLRVIDILPTFYLIGILMLFFHSKHKRLGDLTAGTIVVYERKFRKKKKKSSAIEKEIEKRGISIASDLLDAAAKQKIKVREWKLLKTYIDKRPLLKGKKLEEITIEVARILLPLLDIEVRNKTVDELENNLLVIYMDIREEWEYGV